ncbi:MAG: M20/M25/M40 family metallo-hydrolase [Gemmatimonadetes bacterium]|nr:M20/M25/M40 family metallo-hydrolase [Gemmatimonadota bacterium]
MRITGKKIRRLTARALLLSVAWLFVLVMPSTAHAQEIERLTGYTLQRSADQLNYEVALRSVVDTAHARWLSSVLSAEPHVAGTQRQRWTAEFVDSLTRSWGLETQLDSYLVYLPHPVELAVRRVSPDPLELRTFEPPIAGDPATLGEIFPQFNAYSGRGDVTAELVYVNYGLIEDYELLAEAGVSVEGKIAIARYGRSYRGIKAREAERNGAIGLLFYSDPIDDGFVRGDVYPEGRFRPEHGVQRGSIKNLRGDPSSPNYSSDFGVERLPESEMEITRIPVAPISYSAASELLEGIRGSDLPIQAWQGGLPFRYHVGPGPVVANLVVETESESEAFHPIYNTLAVLRGTKYPREWVIIGGHRDAWGPGATDNVSGTVSVLEAARAFAELARAGQRPERTIVFATWDAEEWGLIGSTEFVERFEEDLSARVVAYINQDVTASGTRFGASAAASLKELIREVTEAVENPYGSGSLYEYWADNQDLDDGARTSIGDLGGGSDFVGFYNHLGIASANFGFGGSGGVYHSAYDTHRWMSQFGDPGFVIHAASGRLAATLAARIARADVIPYSYRELEEQLESLTSNLGEQIEEKGWQLSLDGLRNAIQHFGVAARRLEEVRTAVLAAHPSGEWETSNQLLLRVDKALTRESGVRGRPWYRNLLFAADRDNGYANVPLPSITEAIRDSDRAQTETEVDDFGGRVRDATAALAAVVRSLEANR